MTKAPFADLAKPARKLNSVFVGIGKEDAALPRARQLSEALAANGVKNICHETDGGHTYPVSRKLLVESAPLLFKKGARPVSD